MKAISIWQPWASAIEKGIKTIETRSWETSYRGEILICSSKKKTQDLKEFSLEMSKTYNIEFMKNYDKLLYGYGLAVAVLEFCQPTDSMAIQYYLKSHPLDLVFGDYSPNRFAWVLSDIKPLRHPIPVIGRQGLFDVELPF